MRKTAGVVYLCVWNDSKKYIGYSTKDVGEKRGYWGSNDKVSARIEAGTKPLLALLAYGKNEDDLKSKEALFHYANNVESSTSFLNEKMEMPDRIILNSMREKLDELKLTGDMEYEKLLIGENMTANVPIDRQKVENSDVTKFENQLLYTQ